MNKLLLSLLLLAAPAAAQEGSVSWTGSKGLGTDSVDTDKIKADSVNTTKVQTDAVTGVKIINGAVSTPKLATDAVTDANIINSGVNTAKLATDSVTSAKVLDTAISTNKLATDSVTGSKVLNAAISTAKLASDAVDTAKILTDSVTGPKILNRAVSDSKLTTTGVTANTYGDGSNIPQITVDAQGRLTAVANVAAAAAAETNTFTSSKTLSVSLSVGRIGTSPSGTILHASSGTLILDGNVQPSLIAGDGNNTGKIKLQAPASATSTQYLLELASGSLVVNSNVTGPQAEFSGWSTAQGVGINAGEVHVGGKSERLRIQYASDFDAAYFDNIGTGGTERFLWRKGSTHMMRLSGSGALRVGSTDADGSGPILGDPPATQTIAAGNTITADACGTVKAVDAGGAVTTSTVDTITAPAAGNAGCCLNLVNVDTVDTITLDQNANNNLAADTALGPCDTVRVCSTGASGKWYFGAVFAGTCN